MAIYGDSKHNGGSIGHFTTPLKKALNNPYFRKGACTDLNDLTHAVSEIRKIIENNPTNMRAKQILNRLMNQRAAMRE